MATRQVAIADVLGVAPDSIEGELKIRGRPEDPQEKQRAHDKEILILKIKAALCAGGILAAVVLCWMFMHYGKPEQAEKVFATAMGVVGGYGVGRVASGRE